MVTSATLFDRFFGRDEELRYLVDFRTRSAREASGGVVLLGGDAGIGKSRLLHEFERAVARERGAHVSVRCEDSGLRPYGTLLDILRELARVPALKRVPAVASAIEALTSAAAVDVDDAGERSSRRSAALRDAIEEGAARLGHLCIVVDDAQWIDFGSLEGLRHLCALAKRVPLMLVVAYRPDDIERDAARVAGFSALARAGSDTLVLRPLSPAQMLAPLRVLLPKSAKSTLLHICDLSEGKPYVAEELARGIIERPETGDVKPTISLRGTVLGRVATLGASARELLEVAAVHGRVVRYDDLFAMGHERDVVFQAVRSARDLQLVAEVDERGDAAFRFRHSLTREILYRELLFPQRQAIHLEIAAHLEGTDAGRAPELAYHLAAGGDIPRSIVAFERAGDRAFGVAAFGDAGHYLERAANAASDPDDIARLAHKHLDSVLGSGKHDELPDSAMPWYERLRETGRTTEAFTVAIKVLRILGEYRSSAGPEFLKIVRANIPKDIAPELRFEFEMATFFPLILRNEFAEAAEAVARAEWVLRPRGPQDMAFVLNAHMALAYHWHEDNALAEDLGRQALRLNVFAERPRGVASLSGNLAIMASERGDFHEALRLARSARHIFASVGLTRWVTRMEGYDALFSGALGDFATPRSLIENAHPDVLGDHDWLIARVSLVRAIGGPWSDLERRANVALDADDAVLATSLVTELAWIVEDAKAVREMLRCALPLAIGYGQSDEIALAVATFGSDEDFALICADRDRRTFGAGDVKRRAYFHVFEAMRARREHRCLAAAEHARTAIPLCEQMGLRLLHAQALELAGRRGAAIALLRSIGAVAELARLEAGTDVAPVPALSQRVEQVARLAAEGLTSREIGERLRIATRTVEAHIVNAYEKIGVHSRAELANFFEEIAG